MSWRSNITHTSSSESWSGALCFVADAVISILGSDVDIGLPLTLYSKEKRQERELLIDRSLGQAADCLQKKPTRKFARDKFVFLFSVTEGNLFQKMAVLLEKLFHRLFF